jgi:hypothetical protein
MDKYKWIVAPKKKKYKWIVSRMVKWWYQK